MTDEFGTLRHVVADVVRSLGYEPVSMDNWAAGHGELRAWLRQQIENCEGMVHIPGIAYGAEPEVHAPQEHGLPAHMQRYSYTQYEFLYAQARGIKTWVIQPGAKCTRDKDVDQLDVPKIPMSTADAIAWQMERRRLQQQWNQHLRRTNHIRHRPRDDNELRLLLHNLRDHAEELRQRFSCWQEQIAGGLDELKTRVSMTQCAVQQTREEIRSLQKLERKALRIRPGRLAQARFNMIDKVREYWIEGVLNPSLNEASRFELGHELVPEAVVTAHLMPEHDFDSQDDMGRLFDDSNRRLLILGSPGGGKTMKLLSLTQSLLDRAQNDVNAPIPVVLNLSSWWRSRLPLDQWMVHEAATAYRIQPHIMTRWLRDNAVIPLLDGLDEVGLGSFAQDAWIRATSKSGDAQQEEAESPASMAADVGSSSEACVDEGLAAEARLATQAANEARMACLLVINEYVKQKPEEFGVAVCCRTAEYEELSGHLELNCALRLQELNRAQVDTVLNAETMQGVRRLVEVEPWMEGMIRNPFLLNVMSVAYRGAALSPQTAQAARQEHLMAAYVRRRLTETVDRRTHSSSSDATSIRDLLQWLARNMATAGQSVLHVENLQMTWLQSLWARCAYCISMRLLLALFVLFIGAGAAFLAAMALRITVSTRGIIEALGMVLGIAGWLAFPGVIESTLEWHRTFKRDKRILAKAASLARLWAGNTVTVALTNIYTFTVLVSGFLLPERLQYWAYGMVMGLGFGAVFSSITFFCVFLTLWAGVRSVAVINLFVITSFFVAADYFVQATGKPPLTLQAFMSLTFVFGLYAVALAKCIGNHIRTTERLGWQWSWRGAASTAFSLMVLMITYLLFGAQESHDLPLATMLMNIGLGVLMITLLGGVLFGIRRSDTLHIRVGPNEGVSRSLAFSIKLACGIGLLALAWMVVELRQASGLWPWEIDYWREPTEKLVESCEGLAAVVILAALIGGVDVPVKHYTLRVLLFLSDGVPLRLLKELKEISQILLIRRVGGGFIFVHRYLLEYFAAQEARGSQKMPKKNDGK